MGTRNTRIRSSEETRAIFGKKLLDAIRDNNMNQSDLARRLGLTKDAISSYVRGRCLPKDETMIAICAELGIDEVELLPRRYDTSPANPQVKLVSVNDNSGNYFLTISIVCNLEEANKLIASIPRGSDVINST